MIENYLKEEDLIKTEPILQKLKFDTQLTYDDIIKGSFVSMINELKNRGYQVRRLSRRLELQAQTDVATTNESSIVEDRIERLRLVIEVASQASEQIFKLLGSDDEDLGDEETVLTYVTTEAGTFSIPILENLESNNIFRYYRLSKETSGQCDYKSYLIEITFDLLHLWLTLAMIFETQTNSEADVYEQKAIYYREMFITTMNESKFTYDDNDDGEIDEVEEEANYTRVTLRRG